MKYLILIYANEQHEAALPPAELESHINEYFSVSQGMRASGAYLAGEGLQPTATATTVRVKEGRALHTDGPFAETREQLGGFYLIDVPSLDDALEWAAKLPAARHGSVEVRPVMNYGE